MDGKDLDLNNSNLSNLLCDISKNVDTLNMSLPIITGNFKSNRSPDKSNYWKNQTIPSWLLRLG